MHHSEIRRRVPQQLHRCTDCLELAGQLGCHCEIEICSHHLIGAESLALKSRDRTPDECWINCNPYTTQRLRWKACATQLANAHLTAFAFPKWQTEVDSTLLVFQEKIRSFDGKLRIGYLCEPLYSSADVTFREVIREMSKPLEFFIIWPARGDIKDQ